MQSYIDELVIFSALFFIVFNRVLKEIDCNFTSGGDEIHRIVPHFPPLYSLTTLYRVAVVRLLLFSIENNQNIINLNER